MDSEISSQKVRQRSSRRLKHEAQVQVFKSHAGSLEDIRRRLGMRPSEICDLLKVHPSAWIRWTRTNQAPPHIYQMLDWYLELQKWRNQHLLAQSQPVSEHGFLAVDFSLPKSTDFAEKTIETNSTQEEKELPQMTSSKWMNVFTGMWVLQFVLALTIIYLLLNRG